MPQEPAEDLRLGESELARLQRDRLRLARLVQLDVRLGLGSGLGLEIGLGLGLGLGLGVRVSFAA